MPSGFQQDSNQLSPSYYRVQINMGWWGSTQATWVNIDDDIPIEAKGRINPFNWDNYSTLPSSVDNGIALANGNATTLVLVLVQNASPFAPTSNVQLGSSTNTAVSWLAGLTPVATASIKEVLYYSVVNVSGTYTVLGQLIDFA